MTFSGNLTIKVGFMFTLYTTTISLKKRRIISGTKGELTNWQFDWGGRL